MALFPLSLNCYITLNNYISSNKEDTSSYDFSEHHIENLLFEIKTKNNYMAIFLLSAFFGLITTLGCYFISNYFFQDNFYMYSFFDFLGIFIFGMFINLNLFEVIEIEIETEKK